MLEHTVLNLPRNFTFIRRLPARFLLQVLSKGNATKDGTWYQVRVHGHELNLRSKTPLEPGKQLLIEKVDSLNLRVVKELSEQAAQKMARQEAPIPEQVEAQVNVLQYDELASDWLSALALLFIQEEENTPQIFPSGRKIHFSLPLLLADHTTQVQGVFVATEEQEWDLFLFIPGAEEPSEIGEFLMGLPIRQVTLTTEEHIKTLRGGIDVQS